MNDQFHAFGEMLWDCLPEGRHAGGAPFNVSAHLAQLGAAASLISCVGRDALGDEILMVAREKSIDTEFVGRARIGLQTGTVLVTLDAEANATYELVQPAAWDEIEITDNAREAVTSGRGLIYGSLSCRSPYNREQLFRLLQAEGPMKFFDVNLRDPFADAELVLKLAERADVVKLNDIELVRMEEWQKTGNLIGSTGADFEDIMQGCEAFANSTGVSRICVTRAAKGAVYWEDGEAVQAPAPEVTVKDTIGAGDAFMAGLVIGLSRGWEPEVMLRKACGLGGYVASQNGATPLLPREIIEWYQ